MGPVFTSIGHVLAIVDQDRLWKEQAIVPPLNVLLKQHPDDENGYDGLLIAWWHFPKYTEEGAWENSITRSLFEDTALNATHLVFPHGDAKSLWPTEEDQKFPESNDGSGVNGQSSLPHRMLRVIPSAAWQMEQMRVSDQEKLLDACIDISNAVMEIPTKSYFDIYQQPIKDIVEDVETWIKGVMAQTQYC